MYDYLIGVLLFAFVWFVIYWRRPDLRQMMSWAGRYHLMIMSIGFVLYRFLLHDPGRTITPDYWHPESLFDLVQRTGGYGIEDGLFIFFTGAIAAAVYLLVSKRRYHSQKRSTPRPRGAVRIAAVLALVIYLISDLNAIYLLVAFHLFGAAILLLQRADLQRPALLSAVVFTVIYISVLSFLVSVIVPDFVDTYYVLRHTSGNFIFALPLEEYLYSFSLGLFWSQIYMYKHNLAYLPQRGAKQTN